MKNRFVLLLSMCLTAFLSSCVKEHECDMDPLIDNALIDDGYTSAINTFFVSQLDAEKVYEINISNSPEQNAYIRFNAISEIEEPVKKATLKLYIKGTPLPDTKTHSTWISAINEDWDENTLNYDNSPLITHYSTKEFTPDTLSDKMLFEIDVTDILNHQYENGSTNHGFGLTLNIEGEEDESTDISFYSSETKESAYWPAIEIEYGESEEPEGIPEVFYSVYNSSAKMSIYKAWHAGGSVNTETIREGLSGAGYSPGICAEFGSIPEVYFLETTSINGNYQYILGKTQSANDGEILNYIEYEEVDSILFLDNNTANSAYLAGSSKDGAIYIIRTTESSSGIIYQNSVAGDAVNIIDLEESEGSYLLYWIEMDATSENFRVMLYNDLTSYTQVMLDENDFDNSFTPKAFTVGDNKFYLVGDTDTEQGVFYVVDVFDRKSATKIEVNSVYKSNITDLKLDENAEYLYWMNASEDATEGGIMRIKVEGGASEIVYGNIANGFSFEIPPYWVW